MAPEKLQSSAWALGREQHGVVTRAQLIDLGYGSEAIRHRVRKGRIHPVQPGVYAIGRPELSQLGSWLAAVLRELLDRQTYVLTESELERLFLPIAPRAVGRGRFGRAWQLMHPMDARSANVDPRATAARRM